MKKYHLILFLFISQFFMGCWPSHPEDEPSSNFTPVYMTRSQLENSVAIENPKPSIKAGKIYIKDDLMFVNDVNKGFQVYNYSNATNPVAISYIKFPGATDMAIRNNSIYVNQAVDLVSVNYTVLNNSIVITSRTRNSFPQKVSPQGATGNGTNDNIIINWIPNN